MSERLIIFICLAISFASTLPTGRSFAAEVVLNPNDGPFASECDLRISGEIIVGDKDKINQILDNNFQQNRSPNQHDLGTICLNSPGGNYPEALEIIKFFWENSPFKSATMLEPDAVCLSACALIFMAGQTNEIGLGPKPERKMHPSARLGFHAPTANIPDFDRFDKDYVLFSAQEAILSIASLMQIDKHSLISRSLLTRALAVSGTESFMFVDTVGKIAEWQISLYNHKMPKEITVGHLEQFCHNIETIRSKFDSGADGHLDLTPDEHIYLKPFPKNSTSYPKIHAEIILKETDYNILSKFEYSNGPTVDSNPSLKIIDERNGEILSVAVIPDPETMMTATLPGYGEEALFNCVINVQYKYPGHNKVRWYANLFETQNASFTDNDEVGPWFLFDFKQSIAALINHP